MRHRLQCDGWAAPLGPLGSCSRPALPHPAGVCAPETVRGRRGASTYTPAGGLALQTPLLSELLRRSCRCRRRLCCASKAVHGLNTSQPSNRSTAGDMWGLGAVLLSLVCGDSIALGAASGAGSKPASLDDLQAGIASQLALSLQQASASCSLSSHPRRPLLQPHRKPLRPHHRCETGTWQETPTT